MITQELGRTDIFRMFSKNDWSQIDLILKSKDSGLLAYSLALLNNVAFNVVEFAKSQIDWMSEKLMNMFREKRSNPFQFRWEITKFSKY